MNKKLLTVSIAAWQAEATIETALRSLCGPDVIGALEVFVVDDGGTDKTLEIAKRYESRFPDSVHAVHKQNGGYGSTVNYSLSHATGTYFKLLDGDDWFDPEGLKKLLEHLETGEADLYMTDNLLGPDDAHLVLQQFAGTEGTRTQSMDGYTPKLDLNMWSMAVRTETLKESGLVLPEHMLYTDAIFVVHALACAKTVRFLEFPVYCYRTGRDGQSMSKASVRKHYPDMVSHALTLAEYYKKNQNSPNKKVLLHKIAAYHAGAIRFLLWAESSRKHRLEIKDLDQKVRTIAPDVYQAAAKAGKTGKCLPLLRRTDYLFYWLLKPWF